jgi:hypothetical protein
MDITHEYKIMYEDRLTYIPTNKYEMLISNYEHSYRLKCWGYERQMQSPQSVEAYELFTK